MYRQLVNPGSWPDQLGHPQAVEVENATHYLYIGGQTSVDSGGQPLHAGDMGQQLCTAIDNVQEVLDAAAMRLSDVVHLRIFTTSLNDYAKALPNLATRLDAAGCRAARTELQVDALRHPDLLITVEAIAAR